ncbi:ShlB/FhaC/HecB family hemolysin secretion/activation protein [Methylosinus sp. H3A]|uniref:ShlB/FhaC/HecB family hemolysin secretion/activation protein n=1 Tax=Methylosinus sp. H3A TaxID=2785786 RepID=UPI002897D01F|nr:ShlB/FhaC/HecB family hemolysin secretion/activation protein [Methylosinus sp. H3A]
MAGSSARIADGPLASSEQISVGGLDTVRGYLESEVLGDTGAAGTVELRQPQRRRNSAGCGQTRSRRRSPAGKPVQRVAAVSASSTRGSSKSFIRWPSSRRISICGATASGRASSCSTM